MKLPQFISDSIQNPASVIQFAKDGKYEEAWIIQAEDKKPSQSEIENYLHQGIYKNLIVEFVWNPDVDAQRFVLTIGQDKTCKITETTEFVTICLEIFYSHLTFLPMVNELNEKVIGNEFLFTVPIERVRLGVFNHWFSVGPAELWSEGNAVNDVEIEQKIQSRPEVKETALNYQGLAFIYNLSGKQPGPYHVLKTPCCSKVGDQWVVDRDLVIKTIHQMVG